VAHKAVTAGKIGSGVRLELKKAANHRVNPLTRLFNRSVMGTINPGFAPLKSSAVHRDFSAPERLVPGGSFGDLARTNDRRRNALSTCSMPDPKLS
jgi:hypothetical protein